MLSTAPPAVLLTAVIAGLLLRTDGGSALDPEARFTGPVLQRREAPPTPGSYELRDAEGRTCIKARMGVEFIVPGNQTSWSFSLDPSRVGISGRCSQEESLLSLRPLDDSAALEITFTKGREEFFVSGVAARLSGLPVCRGSRNGTCSGCLSHTALFRAAAGCSFGCSSPSLLPLSAQLHVRLLPLRLQAFGVPNGRFGKEEECWADFNRRALPVIVGSVATGVLLSMALSFLIIRDRRRPRYEAL